ncbi:hypothetical protein ONS95_013228 [Cadophora gregata]|uniref:uncharacterized protein n=1 Tax=Cadophora gregata TaxID=51156 RepID=UPI0026DB58DA|nr:uncharacterized protein ONS95_013228 [Cadophora gregata]KAK0099950.1 hypothetical protein ONS96_007895 [Cadophora gregata f. sp. sojae]KAK0116198.1 hypothetical protein ONS95_013228 [Cadophora gregata]
MVQQLNTACLIIIVVVEVVGSIFCLGRLGSRMVASRRSWRGLMMWSDICMLAAWFLSLGETITMYKVTEYGHYGYHREDTFKLKYDMVLIWKYLYANGITYNPILGLIKASMILLYLRLGGTKTGVRTACCVLFIFNFLFITGALMADIFQCWPITYTWNRYAMDRAAQIAAGATDPGVYYGYPIPTGFKNGKYVHGGECIDMGNFLLITAGISILTDLLILLIPVYMVYDMQLTPKKKSVVLLVLCMGVAVTAVGITRLWILFRNYHPRKGQDWSYSVKSTIANIETGLALVTGCIPDLFPLLRLFFPNFLRSEPHLAPNPYPVKSESGSSVSRRMRNVLTSSRSRHRTAFDEERSITFGLETFGWRSDELRMADVDGSFDGGGTSSQGSLTRSEETAVEEVNNANDGILKTTMYVVRSRQNSDEQSRWSVV